MNAEQYPLDFGFRAGDCGTHTSRTTMFAELSLLLKALPPETPRAGYLAAIQDDNLLNKSTAATRILSGQRLCELYALSPKVTVFRALRRYWERDTVGHPLLALLCALARDPLLRATATPVLALRAGEELSRQRMTEAIRQATGDRMNDATLDKVARNASASWLQSGHLTGRVRKLRRLVRATPDAVAYALLLGFLQGHRGSRLFDTEWTQVLDASPPVLRQLALDAKRLGGLDLRMAGDIIEVGFSRILSSEEVQASYVTHGRTD